MNKRKIRIRIEDFESNGLWVYGIDIYDILNEKVIKRYVYKYSKCFIKRLNKIVNGNEYIFKGLEVYS